MKIRAINKNDIGLNEWPIFQLNEETKYFHMIEDDDFKYLAKDVLSDDEWIVFVIDEDNKIIPLKEINLQGRNLINDINDIKCNDIETKVSMLLNKILNKKLWIEDREISFNIGDKIGLTDVNGEQLYVGDVVYSYIDDKNNLAMLYMLSMPPKDIKDFSKFKFEKVLDNKYLREGDYLGNMMVKKH